MARFQAFANAGDWGPIAREMLENGDLTEADLSTARGGIRLSSGRAKGEKKRLAAELQGSLALDFNADQLQGASDAGVVALGKQRKAKAVRWDSSVNSPSPASPPDPTPHRPARRRPRMTPVAEGSQSRSTTRRRRPSPRRLLL